MWIIKKKKKDMGESSSNRCALEELTASGQSLRYA